MRPSNDPAGQRDCRSSRRPRSNRDCRVPRSGLAPAFGTVKRVEVPVLGSILSTASPTVAHSASSDALAKTASDDTGKGTTPWRTKAGRRERAGGSSALATSAAMSSRAAAARSIRLRAIGPSLGRPSSRPGTTWPSALGRALNHGKNLRKVVGAAQSNGIGDPRGDQLIGVATQAHATLPSSAAPGRASASSATRSASRLRDSVDLTLPRGMSSAAAISATGRSR